MGHAMIHGMNTVHRFSFPTSIHFGPGARGMVAGHLLGQGLRRPLIVTSNRNGRLELWGMR